MIKTKLSEFFRKLFKIVSLQTFRLNKNKKQENKIEKTGVMKEKQVKETPRKIDKTDQSYTLTAFIEEILAMKLGIEQGQIKKHKPLLLLSILQLIESQDIVDNKIHLDGKLTNKFQELVEVIRENEEVYKIELPYYHLKTSKFWFHRIYPNRIKDYEESLSISRSKSQTLDLIEYSYFQEECFSFLLDSYCRNIIKLEILDKYFSDIEQGKLSELLVIEESDSEEIELSPQLSIKDEVNKDILIEDTAIEEAPNEDSVSEKLEDAISSNPENQIIEEITESDIGDVGEINSILEDEEVVPEVINSSQEIPIRKNYISSEQIELEILTGSIVKSRKRGKVSAGSKRKKVFKYDLSPIPILEDELVSEFLSIAESGTLREFIGGDVDQFEILLLNAFKEFEIIGDVPISQGSYDFIIELVQSNFIKDGKRKIYQVPPAIFVASMVFHARYSNEEARNFWKPYADNVWDTENKPYFQSSCRQHFVASKRFLHENFDYKFPSLNKGGVVRPVYYQAIIPYYLQNNFAEWLVTRFEQLLEFSLEVLPDVLAEEKSLDRVPGRLKNFVQQPETKDSAAYLIQQMAKAIKLFQITEKFETVNSVMDSPIERSLWVHIYKEILEQSVQIEKIRQFAPDLEWVWDIENNDLNLMLSHVRSSKDEKPNLMVWAKPDVENLLKEDILIDIHPWPLSNGDWELEPEIITRVGDFAGNLYILSENFDLENDISNQHSKMVLKKEIPTLNKECVYFYVPENRKFAKEKQKIERDGEWIVISKKNIKVLNTKNEPLLIDALGVPEVLASQGYHFANRVNIKLPIIIDNEIDFSEEFFPTEALKNLEAHLKGEDQILGLSGNVQQIFRSSNINLEIDSLKKENEFHKVWLSIHKGGEFLKSISFKELKNKKLIENKQKKISIKLSDFIEMPGSYSLSVLFNLESVLENPVEFAYMPDVEVIGPDPDICYSPVNPINVKIKGAEGSEIITDIDERVKKTINQDVIELVWKEMRIPECRFSLQWEGNNVNYSWDINRVTAWIEGGSDKNVVTSGQEELVNLNVRGESKEEFSWSIKDSGKRRKLFVDFEGKYCKELDKSSLRDMLKHSKFVHSEIEISIRNIDWKLFDYVKIPKIEFSSILHENGKLFIKLDLTESLIGDFGFQLRNLDRPIQPIQINSLESLNESHQFEIELEPGNYEADLYLDTETIIATSKEFLVEKKKIPANLSPEIEKIEVKSKSKSIFNELTKKNVREPEKGDAKRLSAILTQITKINDLSNWSNQEKLGDGIKKLLPTWAVLKNPLIFQTKRHKRLLNIYPQVTALEGKIGKGYMVAKIDQESVKIYAAWNTDFYKNKTYLWLMFSPQKENIDFCELDEYDLWPGYLCRDCGVIVGSRDGNYLKLPPKTVLRHKHIKKRKIKDQFVDVVYSKHIEVSVAQNKKHYFSDYFNPSKVVGINAFKELENGGLKAIEKSLNSPIDTLSIDDYYLAISELINNYKDSSLEFRIKVLFGKKKWFEKIKEYIIDFEGRHPAFSAFLRLEKTLVESKELYKVPKYILLLGLLIRLKANDEKYYSNLLSELQIAEKDTEDLMLEAYDTCPKLLEWSLAWAEIFFNHSLS
jgi:hypothetical protein